MPEIIDPKLSNELQNLLRAVDAEDYFCFKDEYELAEILKNNQDLLDSLSNGFFADVLEKRGYFVTDVLTGKVLTDEERISAPKTLNQR